MACPCCSGVCSSAIAPRRRGEETAPSCSSTHRGDWPSTQRDQVNRPPHGRPDRRCRGEASTRAGRRGHDCRDPRGPLHRRAGWARRRPACPVAPRVPADAPYLASAGPGSRGCRLPRPRPGPAGLLTGSQARSGGRPGPLSYRSAGGGRARPRRGRRSRRAGEIPCGGPRLGRSGGLGRGGPASRARGVAHRALATASGCLPARLSG
jgi:hypothetical protein